MADSGLPPPAGDGFPCYFLPMPVTSSEEGAAENQRQEQELNRIIQGVEALLMNELAEGSMLNIVNLLAAGFAPPVRVTARLLCV